MALERILDEHLTRYEDEMALVDRYCPKCHVLVRNTRCPLCGRRWLEEPESEDYCFLTEKELVWAGVLEDCFRQNQILYLTESTLGAGLTAKAGSMFESIKFYVRYDDFHRAEALTEELFSSDVQEDAGADPVV